MISVLQDFESESPILQTFYIKSIVWNGVAAVSAEPINVVIKGDPYT